MITCVECGTLKDADWCHTCRDYTDYRVNAQSMRYIRDAGEEGAGQKLRELRQQVARLKADNNVLRRGNLKEIRL